MFSGLEDTFGRQHSYLRISVTDRCNFRCVYCMPEEGLTWVPRTELLQFEEIARLVTIMAQLGIQKVRLTGGEPTLRSDIISLIASLKAIDGIEEIAMTTNGHTLAALASPMAKAGLDRVNVSIDTVNPELFSDLTRGGNLQRVLDGIEAARLAGLTPIKLNAVILADQNDEELFDLVDYASRTAHDTELRFIEYMPFEQRLFRTVKANELRSRLSSRYTLNRLSNKNRSGGPAQSMEIEETGLKIGFISPLSEHFCASCNRLRLMADGNLRTCLAHEDTPSLRDLLRSGYTDMELAESIQTMVLGKPSGHDCMINGGTLFEGTMTAIGG